MSGHHTKPRPTISDACMSRKPVIAHDDEYSSAIANRNSRHDILDADNGGPDEAPVMEGSPGSGSASGSSGPPTTGRDETGIPMGMS
jgi:hypothetical protein